MKTAGTPAESAKAVDHGYTVFLGALMAVMGVIMLAKWLDPSLSPPLTASMSGVIGVACSPFLVSLGISIAVTSAIDYAHSKKK